MTETSSEKNPLKRPTICVDEPLARILNVPVGMVVSEIQMNKAVFKYIRERGLGKNLNHTGMLCKHCGRKNPPEVNFCDGCGESVMVCELTPAPEAITEVNP